MKFREYDNIFPKVLVSTSKEDLERQITENATKFNMIDLQYSTTTVELPVQEKLKTGYHLSSRQAVEYSALMLLQEKKVEKKKKLLNEGAKNEVSE